MSEKNNSKSFEAASHGSLPKQKDSKNVPGTALSEQYEHDIYDPYDSALHESTPSVSPWKRSIGTLNQNFPASALIGNTKFYT